MAASLLARARAGAHDDAELLVAWDTGRDGRIRFFAMRIPPWPLLVSEVDGSQAQELMELWLEHDPGIPGVSGVPGAAEAVERSWAGLTGGHSRCRMRDAMHQLEQVIDPPLPPAGELKMAREEDRALLVAWEVEFVREAGVIAQAGAEADRTVTRRLAGDCQYLWHDGPPVSTVAISPEVAGIVRIGPVYTPPEQRGRGYASAAVAGVCHRVLAAGASRCMLFTDLTNPTSNKIYAALGFRRFGDWIELDFEPGHGSSRSAPGSGQA